MANAPIKSIPIASDNKLYNSIFLTGLSSANEHLNDQLIIKLQAHHLPTVTEKAVVFENDRYWLSLMPLENRQYQLTRYDLLALQQAPERLELTLPKDYERVSIRALSQDGQRVLVCATPAGAASTTDCYLYLNKTDAHHSAGLRLLQQTGSILMARFSQTGKYLALLLAQDDNWWVQVLSAHTAEAVTPRLEHGHETTDLKTLYFSADESQIISAGRHYIKQWSITGARQIFSYETDWQAGGNDVLMWADYDIDTARLFQSIAYDNGMGIERAECLLVDFAQHKIRKFTCQAKGLLRPEHSELLTGKDWLKPAGIVNTETGKPAVLPAALSAYLQRAWLRMDSVQFSPDGQWLAYQTCDDPQTLQHCGQWSLLAWQTGRKLTLQVPENHPLVLQKLTFVPKTFVSETETSRETGDSPDYYPMIKGFDLLKKQTVILSQILR